MSAVLYDEAFLQKIKNWTEKSKINIYGPSEANRIFLIEADKNNDKPIKLPIIALSRNGYSINNPNRIPMSYDGKTLYADENKVKKITAIPITLDYTLDVYTRYYEEADAYMRELLFNIINSPKIKITIPYLNFNLEHHSNIRISSNNIIDNSSSVRLFNDLIIDLQLSINIDDAYIWDSRIKNTVSIGDGLIVSTVSGKNNKITSESVTV